MHRNGYGLKSLLSIHPDDLRPIEEFMKACMESDACDRADPLVVIEARCRRLLRGEPLRAAYFFLRLAPSMDGRDLVDVIRLVEEKLGRVEGVSGQDTELRLDLDCGSAAGLCEAVQRLSCTAAEKLGWGTTLAAIHAVIGDDDTLWSLELGQCHLIDEHDDAEAEVLLRGLLLDMSSLGLSPKDLDKTYNVWAKRERGLKPWSGQRSMLCYGFSFPLLDILEGRLSIVLPAKPESEKEDREFKEILDFLGEVERELVGSYWDNGFTVSSIDPFPGLRSLCPRDAAELLRKGGESVEKVLLSSGFAREEHGVLVLGDGTLVEVNCSAYLDADNWVKVHSREKKRIVEVLKKLLRGYYEEKIREVEDSNVRKLYRALLKAIEDAARVEDMVAAAAKAREAVRSI